MHNNKEHVTEDVSELRKRTEAIEWRETSRTMEDIKSLSSEEMQKLYHELCVHQIELEKQNEQLRREQNELLSARSHYFELYNLAPVGYCITSKTGLILDANLTAISILGVVRSALVNQPFSRLISDSDQDIYRLRYKQLFETGSTEVTELQMVKGDGTVFWALLVMNAVQNSASEPLCRLTLSDISGRKKVENKLVEMTTEIPIIIYQFYARSNGEMGLNFVSKSSEHVLDLKADTEGYFERFLALIVPEHRESFIASIEKAVKARSKWEYTGMLQKPSGEKIWFSGDSTPLPPESTDDVVFNGTITDITSHKLAEQAIKEHSEMKSKFASMVSHELRSPLTAIALGISLILEDTPALSAEHRNLLELVHENTDRLSRLINNVLDFQKISAGKMRFDIHENDIADLVTTTVTTMALLAQNKGLVLTPDLAQGLPRVRFDKDRIIQVLTNLLSNAIAHTDKGGITVRACYESDKLHVSVRDTGHGIKAGDLPKLFQAFEQLDSGGSRQKGGTGLGLTIAKEIILAHNGNIWAESEPGKGSVFHFTLPIAQGGN